MDILLTGGSGVVGQRAIPAMISLGHRVTATGRSPARLEALHRMGASTLALDLFDPSAVRKIAAGVKRFVQESFAPVYPDSGDRWIHEDTPIRPARYNRTVADAEASASRFTQEGGVGVILRFALLYGSHDRPTQEILRVIKHGWIHRGSPSSVHRSAKPSRARCASRTVS
jgi:2-alkyl-3-oxoalkanoate reductase